MEVAIHRDNANGLLGAFQRRDRASAGRALRSKHSFGGKKGGKLSFLICRIRLKELDLVEKQSPVIVLHTVDLVVHIDREWNAVQALVTHAAPEASGVIRLSDGLQYLKQDRSISIQFDRSIKLL